MRKFLIFALASLLALPGHAQTGSCAFVEDFLRTGSLAPYKATPWDFGTWKSSFILPGFESCFISEIPFDQGGVSRMVDTFDCRHPVGSDAEAAELSLRAILSLTEDCGFPDVLQAGGEAPFPANRVAVSQSMGLAISTKVESTGIDFTLWRQDLRPGLPETTLPAATLVLSLVIRQPG
jgi:hypothetical protein